MTIATLVSPLRSTRVATQKNCEQSLTLNRAQSGKAVRVLQVNGGCDETRRLAELGLYAGSQFTVVSPGTWGRQVILNIGGGRLALGKKLAKQVIVEQLA